MGLLYQCDRCGVTSPREDSLHMVSLEGKVHYASRLWGLCTDCKEKFVTMMDAPMRVVVQVVPITDPEGRIGDVP
jgi:hypothetical protein